MLRSIIEPRFAKDPPLKVSISTTVLGGVVCVLGSLGVLSSILGVLSATLVVASSDTMAASFRSLSVISAARCFAV